MNVRENVNVNDAAVMVKRISILWEYRSSIADRAHVSEDEEGEEERDEADRRAAEEEDDANWSEGSEWER